MNHWWILALIAWSIFVWFTGRVDGRMDQEEKQLLKDFDRVIEEVRRRLGAP